jgi:hypothetical protein
MASSEVLTRVGRIMVAPVRDPDISDQPWVTGSSSMTKNANPKSPNTIEGIPASASVPNLIILVNLPSLVYSVR